MDTSSEQVLEYIEKRGHEIYTGTCTSKEDVGTDRREFANSDVEKIKRIIEERYEEVHLTAEILRPHQYVDFDHYIREKMPNLVPESLEGILHISPNIHINMDYVVPEKTMVLICKSIDPLVIPHLPQSLLHLEVEVPLPTYCIPHLPRSLVYLKVNLLQEGQVKCSIFPRGLRHLHIFQECDMRDLKNLPPNLKYFTVNSCNLSDVQTDPPQFLEGLSILGSQHISQNLLNGLKLLYITHMSEISDDDIRHIPRTLTSLTIRNNVKISGKTFGGLPPELKYLDLSHVREVVDVDIYRLPPGLQVLRLESCESLTDKCVDLLCNLHPEMREVYLHERTPKTPGGLPPGLNYIDLSRVREVVDVDIHRLPPNMTNRLDTNTTTSAVTPGGPITIESLHERDCATKAQPHQCQSVIPGPTGAKGVTFQHGPIGTPGPSVQTEVLEDIQKRLEVLELSRTIPSPPSSAVDRLSQRLEALELAHDIPVPPPRGMDKLLERMSMLEVALDDAKKHIAKLQTLPSQLNLLVTALTDVLEQSNSRKL